MLRKQETLTASCYLLFKITKEKDLVNDFHSRDPEKWALKVVDHLFTKQELADHVIVVNFNKITNK